MGVCSSCAKRTVPETDIKVASAISFYLFSTCCIRDQADINQCIHCDRRRDLLAELEDKTVNTRIDLNRQHSVSK